MWVAPQELYTYYIISSNIILHAYICIIYLSDIITLDRRKSLILQRYLSRTISHLRSLRSGKPRRHYTMWLRTATQFQPLAIK